MDGFSIMVDLGCLKNIVEFYLKHTAFWLNIP